MGRDIKFTHNLCSVLYWSSLIFLPLNRSVLLSFLVGKREKKRAALIDHEPPFDEEEGDGG